LEINSRIDKEADKEAGMETDKALFLYRSDDKWISKKRASRHGDG
jgi:hypothetical protein